MSRFLKSMIVLLAIVAMVTPVMAEDMLSLGGQMRVRGWYVDNDAADDSTSTYADQRLRIGGKFSIADGVSVTFRTDITESDWGTGDINGSGRLGVQQWDRAHLDLAFDGFSVRAGQQYLAFGQSGFDTQSNGLTINTKGAVPVTVFVMLPVDNGSNADGFYYGANLGFGADSFKGNAFVASENAVNDPAASVYVAGANGTFNMDAFKLFAELDYFTGDATDTDDAFGTQLFVDASMAASETLTVGGQLFFALGDDEDTQYVIIGDDFGVWDPLFAHGTGLDNEQIGEGRPFGFFGENSGVIAARVYVDAKVSDAVSVGGSISYLEPEEDAIVTADSAMTLAAGMKYAVMANTSLGALVEYIDIDDVDTDAYIRGGVGLFVNF